MADPRLVQQIVHPDDAGIWQKHRENSLAAPESRVIQFRIRKKDGSVRWVEHAWPPVLGEAGVIQRLRALFNKTGHERSVLRVNGIIQETLDLLRSEFVLRGITTQVHVEPTRT